VTVSSAGSPRPWRLLRTGYDRPAYNLSCDEALLRSEDQRPVLRLYGWKPAALSLGYFQPLEPFVERAAAAGVEIVRRQTGGGAIHHDDELTFCVVATPGQDGYPAETVAAYERVHELLIEALSAVGAALRFRGQQAPMSVRPRDASMCFEDHTSMDLVDARGRKVVGSAQRRSDGRVLHHGSIPLTVPSLSPDVGSVGLAAGRTVTWDETAAAVEAAFRTGLFGGRWVVDDLSDAERLAAGSGIIGRAGGRGGRRSGAP
jgi:lipoate-protein ligase A